MEVRASDVERIPRTNLRVPREEFVAVWRAAEIAGAAVPPDWYGAGVAITCRWLACAIVRPPGRRWYMAHAPVTQRTNSAYEELIEAEYIEAEKLAIRAPGWTIERAGWVEAIVATLRWAWCRTGPPPLAVSPAKQEGPGRFIG